MLKQLCALAVVVAVGVPASAGEVTSTTGLIASLSAVSCATPSSCMAVGTYYTNTLPYKAFAERWNGTSWQLTPLPLPTTSPTTELLGVSCPGPTSCFAVGDTLTWPLVEAWNGTSWRLEKLPPIAKAGPSGGADLNGISCTSPTSCTAVGIYGNGGPNHPFASVWNGSKWVNDTPPAPSGGSDLGAVSCTAATVCMATGWENEANNFMYAESSNGNKWTETPVKPLTTNNLGAVSCSSASSCVALGGRASAPDVSEYWNGTTWTMTHLSNGGQAISCLAGGTCWAVGNRPPIGMAGSTARWNGTSWTHIKPAAQSPSAYVAFYGVSCTSSNACMAVGSLRANSRSYAAGLAEWWNGKNWSALAVPDPT